MPAMYDQSANTLCAALFGETGNGVANLTAGSMRYMCVATEDGFTLTTRNGRTGRVHRVNLATLREVVLVVAIPWQQGWR